MTMRKTAPFVLAVLMLSGGMARAEEPLQLSCEAAADSNGPNGWARTVNFRVDPNAQTVELSEPGGSILASTIGGDLGGLAARVQISPSIIQWTRSNSVGVIFYGMINRETGEARAMWNARERTGELATWLWNGRCRRAAAKF